jgi:hypothetical protein
MASLSPHRVISQCGPSTFEAIAEFGPHGFASGHMNAITSAYHWHLRTSGFGAVRSVDTTHARSGRRVLFFELREHPTDERPFLLVYLHRERGEEFAPEREQRFLAAHVELKDGVALVHDRDERPDAPEDHP